jgi:hypothetical protein
MFEESTFLWLSFFLSQHRGFSWCQRAEPPHSSSLVQRDFLSWTNQRTRPVLKSEDSGLFLLDQSSHTTKTTAPLETTL